MSARADVRYKVMRGRRLVRQGITQRPAELWRRYQKAGLRGLMVYFDFNGHWVRADRMNWAT